MLPEGYYFSSAINYAELEVIWLDLLRQFAIARVFKLYMANGYRIKFCAI